MLLKPELENQGNNDKNNPENPVVCGCVRLLRQGINKFREKGFIVIIASESDGIATSGRRGWLDIINGIGWPNLPGIEFDYTDDPDTVEKFNNSETNDSDKEEYYKRVDANFKAENAFMMEHMSRMNDGELLTYAAEIVKFRRLKDFLYINRHENETTGLPDNVEFLDYDLFEDDRDPRYAHWIIEGGERLEEEDGDYGDLTLYFIAAVDPESYKKAKCYGEDPTQRQASVLRLSKDLGEDFEPEMASIKCFDRLRYERAVAAQSGSDQLNIDDFRKSFTLGLAREGIDDGHDGDNFNLYDSSPEYANDPELPMGHEGRVLAWFDNEFNTQSSITGESMMGWRFEDDVTEAERNRAVAAVVSMAQRMGAARWTLECLKMLDDRYEELLDEEERERSRSRLGGIATELSDIK